MTNIDKKSKDNKPKEREPKRGFVIIPGIFAEDAKLNLELRFIMGIIYSLSAEKGYCFASNNWICKKLGLDERAFQRKLLKLESLGYIKRYIKKENSKGEWLSRRKIFINYNNKHVKNDTQQEGCTSNLTPTARQICHPLHVKSVGYNITENITERVHIKEANKEGKYNNHFIELNQDIETDNRYITLNRKPLKKYPDIWLTHNELENVINECKSSSVNIKKVFDRVNIWITNKKLEGANTNTLNVVGALTGWALESEIQGDKIKKQAELTNQRFNKIGE